jgi:RNase P subunit RPR2
VFVSWRPYDPWSYAYLLGLYLGDGHVAVLPRTCNFRITLDARYPGIIDDAVAATQLSAPYHRVTTRRHRQHACVIVGCYAAHWADAFPQTAPGRKHERSIVLAGWQRGIVDRFPQPFLRGLIESDGCRVVNRFTTTLPSGRVAEYAYPRYFFSNLSADIRRLFCEYCERLGVRWTQSNHRNISVAHRDSVAILDAFIGPKT